MYAAGCFSKHLLKSSLREQCHVEETCIFLWHQQMDASYHIGLLSMFSHVTVISSGNRNGFCPAALWKDLNEFDWFIPGKLLFVSAAFVLGTEKEGVKFVSWPKGGCFAV